MREPVVAPPVDGCDVMMAFVMVVLAVAVGVLLAAMESPRAQENRATERFSALLFAFGVAAIAAAAAQELLG